MSEHHTDCPFCETAVLGVMFATSDRFRALYNISPILPGHSLVVPKARKSGILNLDDSEISEFSIFARNVTAFLETVFASDGFNWTIQDGESAGQTVPHLHLHLIPRKSGDLPEPGDWYPVLKQSAGRHIDDASRSKLNEAQMHAVVTHLRKQWSTFRPR